MYTSVVSRQEIEGSVIFLEISRGRDFTNTDTLEIQEFSLCFTEQPVIN